MADQDTSAFGSRLLRALSWFENAALIGFLGLMILLAGGQILLRNLLDTSIAGIDQALRLLVLWVALLGAVAASREDKHISIDLFSRLLPPRARAAVRVVLDLFTLLICATLSWQAARFVSSERDAGVMLTGTLPIWVAELILPVAFALIALRYGLLLIRHLRETFTGDVSAP